MLRRSFWARRAHRPKLTGPRRGNAALYQREYHSRRREPGDWRRDKRTSTPRRIYELAANDAESAAEWVAAIAAAAERRTRRTSTRSASSSSPTRPVAPEDGLNEEEEELRAETEAFLRERGMAPQASAAAAAGATAFEATAVQEEEAIEDPLQEVREKTFF